MDTIRPLSDAQYAAIERICEICGSDKALVTGCSQTRKSVLTRAIVFAYLNNKMGARWSDLEKVFGRERRNIMRSVRTLKGLVQYHNDIQQLWLDVCKKMKEAD